jgi:hypothetical protein
MTKEILIARLSNSLSNGIKKHQEFSSKLSGSLNGNPSIIGCPRKKMRSTSEDFGKVGPLKPRNYLGIPEK